jgi:hypothetical protein
MNNRRLGIIAATGAVMALSFNIANALVGGPPARTPFFAVLLGGNEVDSAGNANAGDQDGRGSATVIVHGQGKLCFGITVTGIDKPTAAHIHRKFAGQNGPIVVTLTPPATGNPGASSKCLSGISQSLLNDIRDGAGEFYINVHTGRFPNGALRGNLF